MEQVCRSLGRASFNWKTLELGHLWLWASVPGLSGEKTLIFWKGSSSGYVPILWFHVCGGGRARLWFQVQLEVKVPSSVYTLYTLAARLAVLVCCLKSNSVSC